MWYDSSSLFNCSVSSLPLPFFCSLFPLSLFNLFPYLHYLFLSFVLSFPRLSLISFHVFLTFSFLLFSLSPPRYFSRFIFPLLPLVQLLSVLDQYSVNMEEWYFMHTQHFSCNYSYLTRPQTFSSLILLLLLSRVDNFIYYHYYYYYYY